jgi:serine/threonine protein kinase
MKELSLINCRLDSRYDIQELLGRGSYAEIYVARDVLASSQAPNGVIVIKALNVFLQNDLDTDLERTLVENFQNEAIALDRVRHPNIISRLGHGTARDLRNTVFHYLVLEYLPGGDLARACREKSLSLEQALFYLEQVCAGLAHAHKNGVIHRDIKPQNLLLTKDRKTVKIADFGVARMSQADTPITRVGTNIYAPPEHSPMFSGNTGTLDFPKLTPAADIYSLAKSAYVLITGESPRAFANQPITELPFSVLEKIWAKSLLQVLQKATQSDSRQRYQNVNDFWQQVSSIKLLAEAGDKEAITNVMQRPHQIPQAHVAVGFSPLAPQKPEFNTSRDLKLKNHLSAGANAPLVVQLGTESVSEIPPRQPHIAEKETMPVLVDYIQPAPKPKRKFLRSFAIFVLFISLFASILYGTHIYLRGGGVLPKISNPFSSQEAIALTDINLRPSPSNKNDRIGKVTEKSRLRIVNFKDNWYEVVIIEHARPKENPDDADRGWVNGKFIDIQE